MRSAVRFILMALLIFCTGCCSTVTNLRDYGFGNITVQDLLKKHFTTEAYDVIKDIPLVIGFSYGYAYAPGTSFWSNIPSLLTGCGYGRKVIVNCWTLNQSSAINTIIHEYTHHLDDLSRDGEADFIDVEQFERAYFDYMVNSFNTDNISRQNYILDTEVRSSSFITDWFGIGKSSERIAYVGSSCATRHCSIEFENVFKKIYRKIGRRIVS